MATPHKKSHSGKVTLVLILLFAAGLASFGYFSQTSELRNTSEAAPVEDHDHEHAAAPKADASDPIFIAKPDDIVVGSSTAPVTIVEYSSLSCPHCAQFHKDILPVVKAKLLDSGRAKLVFRHFALNEPALRGAQLVQCAPADKRESLLNTLFANQESWAFTQSYKDELKRYATEAGMDAASFDSCLADKEGENEILITRQEAATKIGVNGTPSFYINGVMLEDRSTAEAFVKAVDAAAQPAPAEAK